MISLKTHTWGRSDHLTRLTLSKGIISPISASPRLGINAMNPAFVGVSSSKQQPLIKKRGYRIAVTEIHLPYGILWLFGVSDWPRSRQAQDSAAGPSQSVSDSLGLRLTRDMGTVMS